MREIPFADVGFATQSFHREQVDDLADAEQPEGKHPEDSCGVLPEVNTVQAGQAHKPCTPQGIAETISVSIAYNAFVDAGSLKRSRELGKMRLEGKEYIVRDGDVMLFRAAP